jgi:hypothetical protein
MTIAICTRHTPREAFSADFSVQSLGEVMQQWAMGTAAEMKEEVQVVLSRGSLSVTPIGSKTSVSFVSCVLAPEMRRSRACSHPNITKATYARAVVTGRRGAISSRRVSSKNDILVLNRLGSGSDECVGLSLKSIDQRRQLGCRRTDWHLAKPKYC